MTSCESVLALAASYDVEMPLTDAVHRVCHKGLSVDEAMALLLGRSTKPDKTVRSNTEFRASEPRKIRPQEGAEQSARP